MSKDIQKKYIDDKPVYVKKLFNHFFDEQNIKKLYKIYVSNKILECSKMLSYYDSTSLYLRGFNSYTSNYMNQKLVNIDDYLQYLSELDVSKIYKYCYIIQNCNNTDIKNGCYTYLKKIYTELCIILEIDNKTPILLL